MTAAGNERTNELPAKPANTFYHRQAITGQIIVIVFGVPFLVAGIRLLGRRPALHELPEGDRMATIGFKQVGRTVLTLRQKYRNLFWFFVGYTFWEAATGAVRR